LQINSWWKWSRILEYFKYEELRKLSDENEWREKIFISKIFTIMNLLWLIGKEVVFIRGINIYKSKRYRKSTIC